MKLTVKADGEGRKRCRNNTKIEEAGKVYASHACGMHDDHHGDAGHVTAERGCYGQYEVTGDRCS